MPVQCIKQIWGFEKVGAALLLLGVCSCAKEPAYEKMQKPEVVLAVERLQAPTITLASDTVYILAASLVREAGETLQIAAGTVVKVADAVSISIKSGARIEAVGTAAAPIVFTSAAPVGNAGVGSGGGSRAHYWYGLRIYGNDAESSGTLTYVRIEFAGGDENNLGLPCLLLQNISTNTTLSHVQVSYSYGTPSFEFNGGNVQASGLVSYASAGTDFVLRNGYKGQMQNLLAYRHPYFGTATGSIRRLAGLQLQDTATHPVLSNITVLGPGLQNGTKIDYKLKDESAFSSYRVAALITTGGAGFHIRNSVFAGFPAGGWILDDATTGLALRNGQSEVRYSIFQSDDSARTFYLPPSVLPPFTSADFKAFVLAPAFHNEVYRSLDALGFSKPFDYDGKPDVQPNSTSPLRNGANFDDLFSHSFFKQVPYRGAIGTDNWLEGWTNFHPTTTRYN